LSSVIHLRVPSAARRFPTTPILSMSLPGLTGQSSTPACVYWIARSSRAMTPTRAAALGTSSWADFGCPHRAWCVAWSAGRFPLYGMGLFETAGHGRQPAHHRDRHGAAQDQTRAGVCPRRPRNLASPQPPNRAAV